MKSGVITRGPEVRAFEEEFADYVGAKHAVACTSGTAALHLACMAGAIGKNSIVDVPTITFAATANTPLLYGSKVVYSHGPVHNRSAMQKIAMHYAGHAVHSDFPGVVIEDACHALGASYPDGKKVGSCPESLMTCFSFHPAKHITTGEGGMVTTNDEQIVKRLRSLQNNGRHPRNGEGVWGLDWVENGLNYEMSDIAAALGRSQLKRAGEFLRVRRDRAYTYFRCLPDTAKPVLAQGNNHRDSYHLFPVLIDFEAIGKSRERVMFQLMKKGIETQVHYVPLHLQPMGGGKRGDLPEAEKFYDLELSLPMHVNLTQDDVKYVCESLKEVLG